MSLEGDGYTLLKGVFSSEEIAAARDAILATAVTGEQFLDNAGGKILPDFLEIPALKPVAELRLAPKLLEALDRYYGHRSAYRFCGHSDIGINRVVSGWHKDILNGVYTSYMKQSPWSTGAGGERYQILKAGIYLQDHADNSDALQVVPGSHLRPGVDTVGAIWLRPALGDCILFDQRITHRGMERQVAGSRIMVSFGFGANNFFTDAFEAGTRARQRDQTRARFQRVLQ
jgi:hypothetical protein